MIKLNDDLLRELGLDALPLEEKKKMLAHIYETLEMRVGMKLAQQMTDEQLDEFEQFIKNNDEAGALRWLETNFPNYKDVVSAEFEALKVEIRQVAPQILTSARQSAVPPQQPAPHLPSEQFPPQSPLAPSVSEQAPTPGLQQSAWQQPGPWQGVQQPSALPHQQVWPAAAPQAPSPQMQPPQFGYAGPTAAQPQQYASPQTPLPPQPLSTQAPYGAPLQPSQPGAPAQNPPTNTGGTSAPWPPQYDDNQQPPLAA